MYTTCPKCGGSAALQQTRDAREEIPDADSPTGKVQIHVKVQEFRCREQSCEHEFETILREPAS